MLVLQLKKSFSIFPHLTQSQQTISCKLTEGYRRRTLLLPDFALRETSLEWKFIQIFNDNEKKFILMGESKSKQVPRGKQKKLTKL